MKKLLALLLALMMVFALAACDQGDNPGNTDNPGTSQGGEDTPGTQGGENNPGGNEEITGGDGSEDGPDGPASVEKCTYCFDIEGNDRKCDTCGNWLYEKGEAWTKDVPGNLKVTVDDGKFYYIVEKVGEEFYIQMWSSKAEMENGTAPYEDYVTLTEHLTRFKGNAAQAEWDDNAFVVKYADVYEIFAVKVLQALNGTTISNLVEDSLEVAASGTETVAGKDCVVKEYDGLFGTKYKVWLWNSMPLKRMYRDQNMDSFEIMFEIHEWDDSITGFSADVPQ